ncbi:MAG: hypothetical protein ABFS05_12240 [Bacteroidota bacterium]
MALQADKKKRLTFFHEERPWWQGYNIKCVVKGFNISQGHSIHGSTVS